LRRDRDGTSLLEIRPLTGRTNQIRLHLAQLGYPICGDPTYPDISEAETQTLSVDDPPLCLHSWKISFLHPLHGEEVEFVAEPPSWCGGFDDEKVPENEPLHTGGA
jgi:UPF0176 protein